MSNLYIVANRKFRRYDILHTDFKEVDLILCEDVSNAEKLFKHFDINTKSNKLFLKFKLSKIDNIIKLFRRRKKILL